MSIRSEDEDRQLLEEHLTSSGRVAELPVTNPTDIHHGNGEVDSWWLNAQKTQQFHIDPEGHIEEAPYNGDHVYINWQQASDRFS